MSNNLDDQPDGASVNNMNPYDFMAADSEAYNNAVIVDDRAAADFAAYINCYNTAGGNTAAANAASYYNYIATGNNAARIAEYTNSMLELPADPAPECRHLFSYFAKCGHSEESVGHAENCLYPEETFMIIQLPLVDHRCSPARLTAPKFCESKQIEIRYYRPSAVACTFCRPESAIPPPVGVFSPHEIQRRSKEWAYVVVEWEDTLSLEFSKCTLAGGVQNRAFELFGKNETIADRRVRWHKDFLERWNRRVPEPFQDSPTSDKITYYFGPNDLDHPGNLFTLFDHTTLANIPPNDKRCILCFRPKDDPEILAEQPVVSLPCGHTFHRDCIAHNMREFEDFCCICGVDKMTYLFLEEPSFEDYHMVTPKRFHWLFLQGLNRRPQTEQSIKPIRVPYADFEASRTLLMREKQVAELFRQWKAEPHRQDWYVSPPRSPEAAWVPDCPAWSTPVPAAADQLIDV